MHHRTRKVERNVKRISRWIGRLTCSAAFLSLACLPLNEAFSQSDSTTASVEAQPTAADSPADALSQAVESITEPELKRHIDFLASDTLQGREAGMQGNYAAGAYIVDQLRKSNVSPVATGEDYFHYFHPNFRNILAVIPGSDESLKNEFILVGGHYDHVGFGNRTNSRGPFGVVHNGADDNASGTAGVLEIAQSLAQLGTKPKRSILIAFWDGEEKGLLGSKHFVDYPAITLSKIRFHLNADMIGRLRPDGLEISGWQTATGCRQFLAQQNSGGLKLSFMYSYKPESDHWPFFERRVPSLMLHTGKHADYHRPSDDTHLLNMEGIRQVSQFMLRGTVAAANAKTLPSIRNWSAERAQSFTQIFSRPPQDEPSRLGVTYDATLAREGTIRLKSIAAGSPANIAGLRTGDEVLAVGNKPTTESSDFRSLVMEAPTEASFKIRRDDSELEIPVTLRGNPVLYGFRWTMHDAEPGSAIVTHVTADSPGAAAKLKPQHRILKVNGRKIGTRGEFQELLISDRGLIRFDVELNGNFEALTIANETQSKDEQTATDASKAEPLDTK
ncbi:MAG: hypothetical protein ACI92S_003091 [Planctomycetaceae bacterium]|jgi:hypothetical protein